jgi:REP element-mobilizing transposase RayT
MYNSVKHHRRSLRLTDYDYSDTGAYFVTICTQNRACLFGEVVDGKLQLNDAGRLIQKLWEELPTRFAEVNINSFIVMPNHLHGIVLVGAQFIAPDTPHNHRERNEKGAMNRAPTLGEIVRTYKALSTRMIRQTVNSTFAWQRNYYEHIIRCEESLNRIRQYILDNAVRWEFDRENPAATKPEPKDAWDI